LRNVTKTDYHAERMNLRSPPTVPLAPVLAVVLATASCHGCHEDHPYVPYAIGSTTPGPAAPGDAAAATIAPAAPIEAGTDRFTGEPALVAPPGLSQWTVEDFPLSAPDGAVFVLAVVRDFDGDGTREAFAIVRPSDGNDPGRLVFYPAAVGGAPVTPVTFDPPPQLTRDASCTPIDRLEVVGGKSILVELGAQCPMRPSSAPVRWVAIVGAGTAPKVRLAATISDPAGAPALSIDADTADRDGDGRDDVALRVTIEGGGAPLEPGPRMGAMLAWLDRPAGLSRDQGTTEASFSSLASAAMTHAVRKQEAPTVPGYVSQMRALWRGTCAEGGAPRVVGVAGAGAIGCGAGRALETAGLAVVRAYVTMGDPLRALLALDRSERAPATRTPAKVTEAQGWVAPLAPSSTARAVRAIAAVPAEPHGHEPAWGPLAFEPGGKLLVRTAAGVVRVDPDQGDEAAAGGVDWKPGVTSPDGSLRWIEAYDPCDGLPLRASFATGDDMRDVALPVPPSLAGRCAGSRGAPARAIPIAWGPRGLEALVEGAPVLITNDLASASPLTAFLDQPAEKGSPRSPDGKTYVIPTSAGLLVRGVGGARLFRARELNDSYADQRGCVVSDDGTHVACERGDRAWVGAWDAP
jgi:hypothetical protein